MQNYNKFLEQFVYWVQLVLLPIYWLSFLIPRNKNIWLFGSTFGKRFADNPRYFYLYLNQCKKAKIRAIWISHDKKIIKFLNNNDYEAYYYLSVKGIWYCLRGKVYIFDNYSKDINFWTSGGAMKVNLWHGVGNKKINFDNKHDIVRHPNTLWEKFILFPRRLSDEKPSHYILATSPLVAKIFAHAFQVQNNHVIIEGYPRNEVLYEDCMINPLYTSEEQELLVKINYWKQNKRKIIGYFPTFRESETELLNIMDFRYFHNFLEEQRMIFLIKLHPKSKLRTRLKHIPYSAIYLISPNIDTNSFLNKVDVLVTDYSSVYSDFMLLDRPTIAFQYDYERYTSQTRDSYFKFEQYMPEEKAKTMEELIKKLSIIKEKDTHMILRKKSKDKLFERQNVGACRELANKLYSLLQ